MDIQTDMANVITAFLNFAKGPKSRIYQSLILPSIIISEVTSKAHDGGQNIAFCQKKEIHSERTHNKN